MIGKAKGMRGVLYRKFILKKGGRKARIFPGMSRTAQMLLVMKGHQASEYPRFRVYENQMVALPPPHTISLRHIIYPLIKPYAYASIRYDEKEGSLIYSVIEPKLTKREIAIFDKLREGLLQVINVGIGDIKTHEKTVDFLEDRILHLLKEFGIELTDKEYLKIMYYVFRDFVGLNEIEPLMRDPYIEDIGVDGVGIPVFVIHQKFGSIKTSVIYNNETTLKEFVTKLAERCDRYISYAEPLLDGTLPDGARVQASMASDVTTRGPTFSIRKFREVPLTPIDVIRYNTASAEMLAYIWYIIENGANILVAGGVSTGKTSMLNAISMFIPNEMKIVSIEDTRELNLPHENWLPGVARVGFTGTGVGEVDMFQLLKESFRQNPDYLIVGEIRGKEAYVMFQGMASGHPSISTIHAGSISDLIKRLETEPINLSPGLLESLDAVIIMVHARERGKSARRVKEIIEIESVDVQTGAARINKSFFWVPAEDTFSYKGNSWLLGKLSTERGIPINDMIREISRRKKFLNLIYENNITEMKTVAKYLNLYLRNPKRIDNILNGIERLEDIYE
ncbi:MAG: type II/IV secretion system ATPase subunit [Candidatus Aenigmarchaeota archaeon]|nr:type II/IV secretion system ATPase subunit [Candidatus Aenigmarchaeota archaeon]MDI6722291.1 type II/IV secretion system ATPase subunit [Candidatus Aenigmarchaeota archaeon]